jgi:hypothetical protein
VIFGPLWGGRGYIVITTAEFLLQFIALLAGQFHLNNVGSGEMTQGQDGARLQWSSELHPCTRLHVCRITGALLFAFSRRSLVLKEETSLIYTCREVLFLIHDNR